MQKPEDFYSDWGVDYDSNIEEYGFTDIEVLQFLYGRPWDQIALNYVHALHPTRIRVVKYNQGVTMDACTGRVLIQLDENGLIKSIEQEVEVGCKGFENAFEMEQALIAERE